MSTLAFITNLGTWDGLILLVLGLLLFGRRLPEVGRSLGKGIVEFKKGLKGIEDDIETQSNQAPRTARPLTDGAPVGTAQTGALPARRQALRPPRMFV